MNVRKVTSGTGFGLARIKPEGATVVSVGDCDVTFYSGELDFLDTIPGCQRKAKAKSSANLLGLLLRLTNTPARPLA